VLEEFQNIQPDEQVADAENCRIITHMLKSVVNDGTGSAIRNIWHIQSEFAGKTGTTQDQADGWFIGMTPQLVAGAWVGGEDPSIHFRTIGAGAGGHTALPIVGQFFNQVLRNRKFYDLANSQFESPSEVNLALLNIPPYREILEVPKRNIFNQIFGKKEKEHELKMIEKSKEAVANKDQKTDQPKEKKPFWQSMKDAFKKKQK
jgi:penicillin-binding protein 1A